MSEPDAGLSLSARLERLRRSLSPAEWRRMGLMGLVVAALWVVGFVLLVSATAGHYHMAEAGMFGIGTGVLALTFGMRHAFDADHIAAIDNTTRKLMAERKRPLSVGLWFSLGHSTLVLLLAVLLNFGIRALDSQVRNGASGLHAVTTVVGTGVSGVFLYLIAALNVVVLISVVKLFGEMRKGLYSGEDLDAALDKRGFMNRFLGGVSRRIDAPWKMYFVGMLFGLGFDTATEVALLVISSTAAASGLPFYAVLSLPILFAAGMSLFDTLDGCFMNFAYGWAFSRPIRKVYYNLVVTGLSVGVALLIGTVELGGLLTRELGITGSLPRLLQSVNLSTVGYAVVGLFLVTWLIALAVWKFGHVESRWDAAAARALAERCAEPETVGDGLDPVESDGLAELPAAGAPGSLAGAKTRDLQRQGS